MEEAFQLSFGYLAEVFSELKVFYCSYFDSDIQKMNYYGQLILYHLYLDDFKWHLKDNELLDDNKSQEINAIEDIIDDVLLHQKPFSPELLVGFDQLIEKITPARDDFQPVYAVFSVIAEELNIF